MVEPTRVWDGFQWKEVEVVNAKSPQPRGLVFREPKSATAKAEQEKLDARRRLISLQRELLAERAQRSRIDFYERKQAEGAETRRAIDELAGRGTVRHAEGAAALPAELEEVSEMAERLNDELHKEYHQDQGVRAGSSESQVQSRLWHKAWRQIDTDGCGRISFEQFCQMMRRKLHMRPKRRADLTKIYAKLRSVWRRIDEGAGYLDLQSFMAFMKMGVNQQMGAAGSGRPRDGEGAARPGPGWRERLGELKRAEAEEIRQRDRSTRKQAKADLEQWQEYMRSCPAASPAQVRELSAALNARLGSSAGWYSLWQELDHSNEGRVGFAAWWAMVRERVGDDTISDVRLRGIWRVIDADLSSVLAIKTFASFMKLGKSKQLSPQHRRRREAERLRASADEDVVKAQQHAANKLLKDKKKIEAEADLLARKLSELREGGGGGADIMSGRQHRMLQPAQTDRGPRVRRDHHGDSEYGYLPDIHTLHHKRTFANYHRVAQRFV